MNKPKVKSIEKRINSFKSSTYNPNPKASKVMGYVEKGSKQTSSKSVFGELKQGEWKG